MIYYFKKDKKGEILEGRSISYLAKFMDINYTYLTRILKGEIHCMLKTAKIITRGIDENANVDDFFIKVPRGK